MDGRNSREVNGYVLHKQNYRTLRPAERPFNAARGAVKDRGCVGRRIILIRKTDVFRFFARADGGAAP
jgi:hypothetical protein